MDLKDHKVSLFTFTFIFLLLYLPVMGRPLNFEELRLTTYFHSVPTEQVQKYTPELANGSRFSQHWDQYLTIYPPGLMAFYYLWARLSFGDEIFLRIPLLILLGLTLLKLYGLLLDWHSKNEAALLMLLIGLFPLWYRHGTTITPESFNLYFICLSLIYFYEALKRKELNLFPLWIINIVGLLSSYLFIFIIVSQCLAILLTKDARNRKAFIGTFSTLTLLLALSYFSLPMRDYKNPLIFYWTEPSLEDFAKLFKYSVLGYLKL
jgi:4-amino-4-deoxy-L-arabinose transferase-like glycosyltransferase